MKRKLWSWCQFKAHFQTHFPKIMNNVTTVAMCKAKLFSTYDDL